MSGTENLGVVFERGPLIVVKYPDFNNIVARYFPDTREEYCLLTHRPNLQSDTALTHRVSLDDDYGCSKELRQWEKGEISDPPFLWTIVQELLRLGVFRWYYPGKGTGTNRIEEARFIIEVFW
jgi:hypothetical protein